HLGLHELHSPVAQQRGGIHYVLAGPTVRGRYVSADDGDFPVRRARGNLFNDLSCAGDEGWLLQQISRRISANSEFRKNDKAGRALRGPRGEIQDFAGVPVEVSDGGIDLGKRDLHSYKSS